MRSSEWVADPLAAHCPISRVGPRIRSMWRFEMDSIPLRSCWGLSLDEATCAGFA